MKIKTERSRCIGQRIGAVSDDNAVIAIGALLFYGLDQGLPDQRIKILA
jgi:hypothetical protein